MGGRNTDEFFTRWCGFRLCIAIGLLEINELSSARIGLALVLLLAFYRYSLRAGPVDNLWIR